MAVSYHAGHLASDAASSGGRVRTGEVVGRLDGYHVQGHAQLVGAYLSHLVRETENRDGDGTFLRKKTSVLYKLLKHSHIYIIKQYDLSV